MPIHQAGKGVDADGQPRGADAGEPGDLGAVAEGVDVPAPCGLAEQVGEQQEERDREHGTVGDAGAAQLEGLAEEGQLVGQGP
ncbi:hypothetical protein GCM10020219_091060 [Nonomuraea dietziae]